MEMMTKHGGLDRASSLISVLLGLLAEPPFSNQDRGLPYFLGPSTFNTGTRQVLKWLTPENELTFLNAGNALHKYALNTEETDETLSALELLPGAGPYSFHVVRSFKSVLKALAAAHPDVISSPSPLSVPEEQVASNMSGHVSKIYAAVGDDWPNVVYGPLASKALSFFCNACFVLPL